MQAFKVLIQVPLPNSSDYVAYRDSEEDTIQRLDDFRVFRTLYSWSPGETDILSVLTPIETNLIENELIKAFAIDKRPQDRVLQRFGAALDGIRRIDMTDGHTWRSEFPDGDENELLINPIGALITQLDWILVVFGDVPNAIVAVM